MYLLVTLLSVSAGYTAKCLCRLRHSVSLLVMPLALFVTLLSVSADYHLLASSLVTPLCVSADYQLLASSLVTPLGVMFYQAGLSNERNSQSASIFSLFFSLPDKYIYYVYQFSVLNNIRVIDRSTKIF